MSEKFQQAVDWIHGVLVVGKRAPGLIVGLSGTDSIVTFMAAYRALEKAGKPDRLMGVHFAPSRDFLDDYPQAETHLWFNDQVIPWLRAQAPLAKIVVDTSIDWRYDGLRWGMLADMSVIAMPQRRMRASEEKYWLLGTRNATEDCLYNYSIASTVAVAQPIIRLWKSDVLDICEHLKVPEIVISRSCEADCICGREELRARYGRELDIILKAQYVTSLEEPAYKNLDPTLKQKLSAYIKERVYKGSFKTQIPYVP